MNVGTRFIAPGGSKDSKNIYKSGLDKSSPYNNNENITNIVYMGMGEPFLNFEEVKKSLECLTNPDFFGFGSRSISVSTAGIPDGINNLAQEFPQMNLAISLHFATDEIRNKFMPINKKNNLEALRNSLRNYFTKTNRKVFLEYILLEDVNDSMEDAQNLIKYIKSIGHQKLLHINLIRYNSTSNDDLKSSSAGVAKEFKNYLSQNGINVTIRKSLGLDIQGACGQLAGRD
jgi:adenine C2-methylase RlmN of 23S rRNA A2503 and tRNA A37